jgi:DNA-binding XRE family transcriptional regulator
VTLNKQNLVFKLRIEKGWTQPQLAIKAQVSIATISKAENNKYINPLSMSRIASALGKTLDEVFP